MRHSKGIVGGAAPGRSRARSPCPTPAAAANALLTAVGSVASAARRTAGRSRRSTLRAKFTGTSSTKSTSPRAIWRSAATGETGCDTSKYSVARIDSTSERAGRELSPITSAVGRCFGSVLIANPKRNSCTSGIPTISARVKRSRRAWMSSF
jgi:hypothetical protein